MCSKINQTSLGKLAYRAGLLLMPHLYKGEVLLPSRRESLPSKIYQQTLPCMIFFPKLLVLNIAAFLPMNNGSLVRMTPPSWMRDQSQLF